MNKVSERCTIDKHAKFYYASNRLYFELKIIRIILYLLAIVPVVLSLLPQITSNKISNVVCTIVSFAITLINEAMGTFTENHKDNAICSLQLYELGVTGSTYSKIEYDREKTNELNELAIRRGLPKLKKLNKYHSIYVPQDISDDYSYIYICRINAATNKYLLSRIHYIYIFILIAIVAAFIGAIFINPRTDQYLILIIGFWPLISPIIKDLNCANMCLDDCTKVCADIDNFFADGDDSVERLARMHYYIQQIEYEMFSSRPTIYKLFKVMFRRGVEVLQDGVTERFKSAIVELKQKSLMNKGLIAQPKGKSLITQKEYDLEQLKKIEKERKVIKVTKTPAKPVETIPVPASTTVAPAKKPVPTTTTAPAAKKPVPASTTVPSTKKPASTATTGSTAKKSAPAKTVKTESTAKPSSTVKKTAPKATKPKSTVNKTTPKKTASNSTAKKKK